MTHIQKRHARPGKETIHSGHFMVSHFEAEGQDDFDDLAVPVPDEEQNIQKVSVVATYTAPGLAELSTPSLKRESKQQLSIEISLTKLFKCMTLAYRQKLTSPKWNRFKGIKLRWKDKIRLNNVIWRCWHMQFIKKQNTLVCQFASPLDVDTHVKPETTILEGKYWKRRAEAVIAEYKKWRMFHIMRLFGKGDTTVPDTILDMDTMESQCSDLAGNMLADEDYLSFMSDTLFSTITNHQPFAFPDPREIARGASLADFIQPSLGPLQPNLDDFMDTLEPLQDFLPRLPPVPEESTMAADDPLYRNANMSVDSYSTIGQSFITDNHITNAISLPTSQMNIHGTSNNSQIMSMSSPVVKNEQLHMYDNERVYVSNEMQNNMLLSTQGFVPTASAPAGHAASYMQETSHQNNVYSGKNRLHYVTQQSKIMNQQDNAYNKYNSAIPPSQTAPETVSLLQQPVQNQKYMSTIVMQGRNTSGYSREKTRPRVAHYSNQLQNTQYGGGYGQMQAAVTSPVAPQTYERQRPQTQQMQYLQPNNMEYKSKPLQNTVSARPFKMPSPPLVGSSQQQMASIGGGGGNAGREVAPTSRGCKEQYRSHSLPIGAQLTANWTLSLPAHAPAIAPAAAPASSNIETSAVRHTSRRRDAAPGAVRLRSRSSSSGAGAEGGVAHRPPPLTSVASEGSLPKTSVMLAQLLSSQHSQSFYKLNNTEDGGASSDPKSPAKLGQPSPGSDVMSPHQSLSPPASPAASSPRSGSPRESRRTHMHAEQKRRFNIKNGFDTLQALIPQLNTNPTAKISKAAMLQKGAEYIKQLKAERNQIKEDMENLRQQIECLNNSITNCHSLLPATGAPVSRARAGRLREMFARHVATRTMHNWKYWLFSVVAAALVDSFSSCVSCGSSADLVRTTLLWAEQHCSLVEMRPAVLNSLRVLGVTTEILTSPERLPEEARAAATAGASVKTEPT